MDHPEGTGQSDENQLTIDSAQQPAPPATTETNSLPATHAVDRPTERTRSQLFKHSLRLALAGLTGIGVIATIGAVAAANHTIDFGHELNQPLTGTVSLQEHNVTMVCDPSFHGFDEVASGYAQVTLLAPATVEHVTALPAEGQTPDLKTNQESTDTGTEVKVTASTPVAFSVKAPAQARLVGSSFSQISGQSLAGATRLNCMMPITSAWFAVGSTTVENSTTLVISNPANNATTVNLQAWSTTGPLELEPTVTVPALSSVNVNLAAYYPDEERLAVRATTSGSAAAFFLQLAKLDGLTPQGIATVTPQKDPATDLIFVDYDPRARDGYLRLANPAQDSANVTVKLLTSSATRVLPGSENLVVDEGAVFDIPLDGLPAGPISIQVTSDQPIVGSIQAYSDHSQDQNNETTAAMRVWSPATASTRLLNPPASASSQEELRLTVTNPTPENATVKAGELQLTVPAGTTVTAVCPTKFTEINASEPITASIAVVNTATLTTPTPAPSLPAHEVTDPEQSTSVIANTGANVISVNAVTEQDTSGALTVELRR